jgi:hypothetical protein
MAVSRPNAVIMKAGGLAHKRTLHEQGWNGCFVGRPGQSAFQAVIPVSGHSFTEWLSASGYARSKHCDLLSCTTLRRVRCSSHIRDV